MTDAVMAPEKAYSSLLLAQVPAQYEVRAERKGDRLIAVLDYLSGMTDVYALDLYRKSTDTRCRVCRWAYAYATIA